MKTVRMYGIVDADGNLRSTGLNSYPGPDILYRTREDAESAVSGLGTPAGMWMATKVVLAIGEA
jgi:hypothetical protein